MSTILITGATSGIGLEAAVALARQGNRLVLVGRDQRKMNAAVDEVKRRAGVAAVPDSWLCEFGSQAQIRKLASDVLAKYDRLDVLVNNAGLATRRREVTEDGIERTFAVNHLGPFLLTNLLLDLIVKSAPARVVNVASSEHYDAMMDLSDLGFERDGWSIAEGADERKKTNKDNKKIISSMLRRDKEIRRFSLDGNFLIASRISVIVPTSISELVAHKVRFDEMRLSTHVISKPDFGVICRGQSGLAPIVRTVR
jgi:hypothetical protein